MVKTLGELEVQLNKQIKKALPSVAKIIKREIQKSVDDVVYGAGSPQFYNRRGTGTGGLRSLDSLREEYDNLAVDVFEDASAQGKNFDPLDENIELGYGEQNRWYNQPRPFMETAQEYVNRCKDEICDVVDKIVNG